MEQKPTLSQYVATAKHHRRMEQLYTQVGKKADAEAARKAAEGLEREIARAATRAATRDATLAATLAATRDATLAATQRVKENR